MNRLYIALVAFLLISGLGALALWQHDGKLRESIRADTSTKVIAEAVVESKSAVKADAKAQVKKSVALDSVRPAYQSVRELNEKNQSVLGSPAAVAADDAWISVFNDAVRASNSAIESSSDLSGTM